jgi:hypothetical protein
MADDAVPVITVCERCRNADETTASALLALYGGRFHCENAERSRRSIETTSLS